LATVNSKNTGDELGMEIRRLRDEKQALQNEQASRQDLRTRLDEMMRFLNDLPCELTEYEEDYVRTLLEKITVYDDYFIVEFCVWQNRNQPVRKLRIQPVGKE